MMLWVWIVFGILIAGISVLWVFEETRLDRDPDLEAARRRDYALEVLRRMQNDADRS